MTVLVVRKAASDTEDTPNDAALAAAPVSAFSTSRRHHVSPSSPARPFDKTRIGASETTLLPVTSVTRKARLAPTGAARAARRTHGQSAHVPAPSSKPFRRTERGQPTTPTPLSPREVVHQLPRRVALPVGVCAAWGRPESGKCVRRAATLDFESNGAAGQSGASRSELQRSGRLGSAGGHGPAKGRVKVGQEVQLPAAYSALIPAERTGVMA